MTVCLFFPDNNDNSCSRAFSYHDLPYVSILYELGSLVNLFDMVIAVDQRYACPRLGRLCSAFVK